MAGWENPEARTREWAEKQMHAALGEIHASDPDVFADPRNALTHPKVTATMQRYETWLQQWGAQRTAEGFVANLAQRE